VVRAEFGAASQLDRYRQETTESNPPVTGDAELHYSGNCFTCHNVGTDGEWYLLTEKVEVNKKGVPADDEDLPIPGAMEIEP